jgi:hypothetical protein
MLTINKTNSSNQPLHLASLGSQSHSRSPSSSIPELHAPAVTLATLANNDDVWNHICGMMAGETVYMLANMAAY